MAGFLGEPLAQQILDQFGGTVADLTAYVVGVDDNLATTTTMAVATQGGLEQFLTVVAGNPDPSLITVPNGGLPGLAGKAWELVAAVKPAMDQIRTDIASAATKTELQSLVNALCSAPFASMAGNVVNNVNKVGVWVAIVKQEIESLETNLTFVHGKTVENKTAIAALKATVEALEALGVGGGDGTGLTSEQAQLIADTASKLAALEAGTLAALEDILNTQIPGVHQILNDAVEYIIETYTEKAEFQRVLRKFGDSGDAEACVEEFLATLNEYIGMLLDATGVVPPSGKFQASSAGANRIAALEAAMADKSAPAADLTGIEGRITALERRQCCPASATPDPELVRVSNTAVGVGEYNITASNTMGARYMHTPGEFDDYLVVFVGYTIPDVVPGGSVWNITVKYGTQTLTRLGAHSTTGSHPTEKTRGEVQAYGVAITPGKGPQEVVITCTTGLSLVGRAGNPTYTFASNSVSVSNYSSHSNTGTAGTGTTGANDVDTYQPRARYRRLIGMSQVATTPAKTYVQSGAGGPARVLWEASDKDGRRVVIFEDANPSPDGMTIMYGGNVSNRYASGSVTFDVLAPPKVI